MLQFEKLPQLLLATRQNFGNIISMNFEYRLANFTNISPYTATKDGLKWGLSSCGTYMIYKY